MKPKLIHKVIITILNPVIGAIDEVFCEPETPVTYDEENPVIIEAQIKYYNFDRLASFGNGFQPIGDGYLLTYTEDADKIKNLSKIIKIDNKDVCYYIKETKPTGHYRHATLKRVYFESRNNGKL